MVNRPPNELTQTLPQPVIVPTSRPSLDHWVCGFDCDDNLALCGTDVTFEPWGNGTVPNECVVCAELDKLPHCASPNCLGRSA